LVSGKISIENIDEMIELQYFDGVNWITVDTWVNEELAWISLGGDNYNYRTVDKDGNVLTDTSKGEFIQ